MKKTVILVFILLVKAAQAAFAEGVPDNMVSGASVSNERPMPNVLSEQEALSITADIGKGYIDEKKLKIETPVLVFNAFTGEPYEYILRAVDNEGNVSASRRVSANPAGVSAERITVGSHPGWNNRLTKRKAVELIKRLFPDSKASEPIAITNLLDGSIWSSHGGSGRHTDWYFTVDENGVTQEYVFDQYGISMVKLETPIYLFDKIEASRAAGGAAFIPSPNSPSINYTYIEIPLQ